MLENEIKVVDKIINVDKAWSISDYELKWLCKDFNANRRIVFSILENRYNAVYVPPHEPRDNGYYKLNNPNLLKQEYAVLNYIYLRQEQPKIDNYERRRVSIGDYYKSFAKDILLRDDKVKIPLEDVIKTLKEKNAFIGENKIWFITIEKDY